MQRFARLARREAGLDKDKIPPWKFAGFKTPGLTDAEVWESWHRLKKHGVLLVAGGQLDQPPLWWDDMALCDAIYNSLLEQWYDEKDRQKPDGRRHSSLAARLGFRRKGAPKT